MALRQPCHVVSITELPFKYVFLGASKIKQNKRLCGWRCSYNAQFCVQLCCSTGWPAAVGHPGRCYCRTSWGLLWKHDSRSDGEEFEQLPWPISKRAHSAENALCINWFGSLLMSIPHISFVRVLDIVIRTGLKGQRGTTLVWHSEQFTCNACLWWRLPQKHPGRQEQTLLLGSWARTLVPSSVYGNRGLESHEFSASAAGNPDLTPGDFPDPPPQNTLRLRREDAMDTWVHTVWNE